jgi:hypothetical protein
VVKDSLGLQLLVEANPRLLVLVPHDLADRGDVALAKQQRGTLDRELIALDLRTFRRKVAQLDLDGPARDFERGRHQQVRAP